MNFSLGTTWISVAQSPNRTEIEWYGEQGRYLMRGGERGTRVFDYESKVRGHFNRRFRILKIQMVEMVIVGASRPITLKDPQFR